MYTEAKFETHSVSFENYINEIFNPESLKDLGCKKCSINTKLAFISGQCVALYEHQIV